MDKKIDIDFLEEYGYIIENTAKKFVPEAKKYIKELKNNNPWVYHFYMDKKVRKKLKKRYKGSDKKTVNKMKISIINELYGLETPNYMYEILKERGDIDGQ